MMSRIEDEAGKLKKTTERHSKQIQQIEEEIPPMETEITSFDGQIERLQDEIGVSKCGFHYLYSRTTLTNSYLVSSI
jgi:archaellum component FlaC